MTVVYPGTWGFLVCKRFGGTIVRSKDQNSVPFRGTNEGSCEETR